MIHKPNFLEADTTIDSISVIMTEHPTKRHKYLNCNGMDSTIKKEYHLKVQNEKNLNAHLLSSTVETVL